MRKYTILVLLLFAGCAGLQQYIPLEILDTLVNIAVDSGKAMAEAQGIDAQVLEKLSQGSKALGHSAVRSESLTETLVKTAGLIFTGYLAKVGADKVRKSEPGKLLG